MVKPQVISKSTQFDKTKLDYTRHTIWPIWYGPYDPYLYLISGSILILYFHWMLRALKSYQLGFQVDRPMNRNYFFQRPIFTVPNVRTDSAEWVPLNALKWSCATGNRNHPHLQAFIIWMYVSTVFYYLLKGAKCTT